MMMLIARPKTNPVTTGLERKSAITPSRAMPARSSMTPTINASAADAVKYGRGIGQRQRADERRRHDRHRRRRRHLQMAAGGQEAVEEQPAEGGIEPGYRRYAGHLGIGQCRRYADTPQRQAGDQIGAQPSTVVLRQPTNAGHVAHDLGPMRAACDTLDVLHGGWLGCDFCKTEMEALRPYCSRKSVEAHGPQWAIFVLDGARCEAVRCARR